MYVHINSYDQIIPTFNAAFIIEECSQENYLFE